MAGKRSRLELYVDTLQALANNGPANLTRLTTRTKVNSNPLRAILGDLMKRGLVVERTHSRTILYSATPEARPVLLKFKQLAEVLPVF